MKITLVLTHPDYPPYKKSFTEEELAFDINDTDRTMWIGRGIILSIRDWKPNKKIYMQWTSEKGKSRADRYCQPWFLVAPRKMILADKRCEECGDLVLCECHDKCVACGPPCKTQNYNRTVCNNLGKLAMSFLPKDTYDDDVENAIRDAIDSGDYRRSFIEDDEDEDEN